MLPAHVLEAFSTLSAALVAPSDAPDAADVREGLMDVWRSGQSATASETQLAPELRAAARALDEALPALTTSSEGAALGALFDQPEGAVLLVWCWASTWRRDARLAPVLAIGARQAW